MKKILALTIILGLLLTVCGCGANETSSTTKLTTEAEPTKTSEVASDSEASSETDKQLTCSSKAIQKRRQYNVSGSGGLKIADKSLTGIALLESIDWSMPDSYQYMAEVTNTNGETFSMVFWSDGDNIRMESDSVQDSAKAS